MATSAQNAWLRDFLKTKAPVAAQPKAAPPQAAPPQAAPPQAAQPPAAQPTVTRPPAEAPASARPPAPQTATPLTPFDAPDTPLRVDDRDIASLREEALHMVDGAARDFNEAIRRVMTKKGEELDKKAASEELVWTIVLSVMFLPAGSIATAVSKRVSDAATLVIQDKVKDVRVAEHLASAFSPELAKAALDEGASKLKDAAVKFRPGSNDKQTVQSFLEAVQTLASNSSRNLTRYIGTLKEPNAIIGYLNLFSHSLIDVYEAVLGKEADNMLAQVAGPLAQKSKPQGQNPLFQGPVTTREIIVAIALDDGERLASVKKIEDSSPDTNEYVTSKLDYQFLHWITPDMMTTAAGLVSERLKEGAFLPQKLPRPTREPGERIVYLPRAGATTLAIVTVADIGLLHPRAGVLKFKAWVAAEDEEKQLAVGKMQIGGVETLAAGDVEGIKP